MVELGRMHAVMASWSSHIHEINNLRKHLMIGSFLFKSNPLVTSAMTTYGVWPCLACRLSFPAGLCIVNSLL